MIIHVQQDPNTGLNTVSLRVGDGNIGSKISFEMTTEQVVTLFVVDGARVGLAPTRSAGIQTEVDLNGDAWLTTRGNRLNSR